MKLEQLTQFGTILLIGEEMVFLINLLLAVTSVSQAPLKFDNKSNYDSIPTYEGSGQAIHPGIEFISDSFLEYIYWMAFTPYPNGQSGYENPSVVVSNDGDTWSVFSGAANPIDSQPGTHKVNSDTDIIIKDDTLWVIYRESSGQAYGNYDSIFTRYTIDGINWSSQIALFDSTWRTIISPSVIYDNSFKIYYSDATIGPYLLYRREATSMQGTWSSPILCPVTNRPYGNVLWHLDIEYDIGEYLGVTNQYCGENAGRLFFMKSFDGVNFYMQTEPILEPNIDDVWDNGCIYRSCLIKIGEIPNDEYNLWYSGNDGTRWHTGKAIQKVAAMKQK